MRPISSWGRLSALPHRVINLTDPSSVPAILAQRNASGIARGMGRSYGDVSLNPDGILWQATGLNHFLNFDSELGRIVCEAGVLLRDIQKLVVPSGWMLPVTPGTQLVTVGGAIANDVHGKNHHVYGCFGDHIKRIKLQRTDGQVIECSPQLQADWFSATVGGLGLTGVIIEAEIQLKRIPGSWIDTETIPYTNLDQFFDLAEQSEGAWEHTVSWIDCISSNGRGLFMRGNPTASYAHAEAKTKERSLPFVPPFSLVNKFSLHCFNFLYYNTRKWQAAQAITHYESFFYPLDNLHEWNRMYGPRGFFQYQSVVPYKFGKDAVRAMLKEITRCGDGSFLTVLKTFGKRQPMGMLSFPMPGATLALDFPNHGQRTHKLFERLDAIVREAGGRIYLAKDARMSSELFAAGYPRLSEFLKYRDPGISSSLSRRLMGG